MRPLLSLPLLSLLTPLILAAPLHPRLNQGPHPQPPNPAPPIQPATFHDNPPPPPPPPPPAPAPAPAPEKPEIHRPNAFPPGAPPNPHPPPQPLQHDPASPRTPPRPRRLDGDTNTGNKNVDVKRNLPAELWGAPELWIPASLPDGKPVLPAAANNNNNNNNNNNHKPPPPHYNPRPGQEPPGPPTRVVPKRSLPKRSLPKRDPDPCSSPLPRRAGGRRRQDSQ